MIAHMVQSTTKISHNASSISTFIAFVTLKYFSIFCDIFMCNAGFTYRLDIGPQNLGGLRPRCILFSTLLLEFHTYAVIAYCTF